MFGKKKGQEKPRRGDKVRCTYSEMGYKCNGTGKITVVKVVRGERKAWIKKCPACNGTGRVNAK